MHTITIFFLGGGGGGEEGEGILKTQGLLFIKVGVQTMQCHIVFVLRKLKRTYLRFLRSQEAHIKYNHGNKKIQK